MAAAARHFNDRPRGSETLPGGNRAQTVRDSIRSRLIHAATGLADHENDGFAGLVGGRAGNEGVQAFEPVDEALRAQKIERPVDCDWSRRFLAGGGDPFDQIISADRAVRGIERFQHRPPQRREPFAPTRATLLGGGKGSRSAGGLIMRMGAIRMSVIVSHRLYLS
jgi:hypothetical protein